MDKRNNRQGGIQLMVMLIMLVFSVLSIGMFKLSELNAKESIRETKREQAFWLAETGIQHAIEDLKENEKDGWFDIAKTSFGNGTFSVEDLDGGRTNFLATGTVGKGSELITEKIKFTVTYLFPGFKNAIYSGGFAGPSLNNDWELQLHGTQVANEDPGPLPPTSRDATRSGGNDIILGNVNLNGDLYMYDESTITGRSSEFPGDVNYSGSLYQDTDTAISGTATQTLATEYDPPNFAEMDYANNNTYDVAAEFDNLGITSGYLPDSHPLHDVVVKNPGNRASENSSTLNADDYYFEPSRIRDAGERATGETPLDLGRATYYVDGHVWFNSGSTFGFCVTGQSVIVSTQDIHISDNLQYADDESGGDQLALVAMGQLNDDGDWIDGGDIYFGDPRYGTMYTVEAFMFANHDFLYNTSSTDASAQGEPETGFEVFGNFMAVNQIVVERDWYTDSDNSDGGGARAAVYDATGLDTNGDGVLQHWKDAESGTYLSDSEISGLRHYAMKVTYDERILDAANYLENMPSGTSSIYNGIIRWEEIFD